MLHCSALRKARLIVMLALALLGSSTLLCAAQSPVSVLTHHNDNYRTGANLHESHLKVSNVNVRRFGRLYSYPVDGQIYAQPLYLPAVQMPGASVHNVVYIATEHDSVYAFDADDPTQASTPLWHVNLGTSVPSPNPYFGNRYAPQVNILPEYGITGTPVIDPKAGTLYVVAFTQDADGGPYHHRLHALDVTTGHERPGSPVEIAAMAPGSGYGSDYVDNILDRQNGNIIFNTMQALQRPGLLLSRGRVYVAFGSHSDTDPYHGWVMAFDSATLKPRGAFCVTPNGTEGGLWAAGTGLATDRHGDVYFMVGNGDFDASKGNYGDSFVKLHAAGSALSVTDYFTPYDQASLQAGDIDLGSSGPMVIPGEDLLVGIGKEGKLYLLNTLNMGHYDPNSDAGAVQAFPATNGEMHCGPVYYDGPNGQLVYVWSDYDYLKAFKLTNGQLGTAPYAQSAMTTQLSGGALSLSAHGARPGTAILWANLVLGGDSEHAVVPGIFRAFDASNLTEIWNSRQNAARDDVGAFAKFCPPTVANGKVYLATFSNQLAVYGLGHWLEPPSISPNGGTFYPSEQITLRSTEQGAAIYYTTDGTDPTASSHLYSAPFTLSQTATVKAIAVKSGFVDSSVASAQFVKVRKAGVISINFVGGGPDGNPQPMGAGEVAGVVPKSHWNNAANKSGTLSALLNGAGATTGATVTWKSDNTWSTGIPDTAGNYRMMKGYLDTGNVNPTTVTVSGLPEAITAHGYDVYIYMDGGVTSATRTGIYSIGTASVSITDPGGVDFSGTFSLANNSVGNYAVISNVTGAGFTLTATPGNATDGVSRAPLNAIQIVARP